MMNKESTQFNAWEGVVCDSATDYHDGFNLLHFAAAMLQHTSYHTKWEAEYVRQRLEEERTELADAVKALISRRDSKSLFAVIDEVADVAFYTLILRNYNPKRHFHCTISHIKACVLDVLYEALSDASLGIGDPDAYQAIICDLCDATLAHTHSKWLVRSFVLEGDLDRIATERRDAERRERESKEKADLWERATRRGGSDNV